MPAQGALIRASDYRDVRKAVSRILGDKIAEYSSDPDRGKYGYGQTVLSDTRTVVSEIDLVDDLDIGTLRSDVLKIAAHCGITTDPLIQAIPQVQSGDIIDNDHLEAFLAAVPVLNSNRFLLAPGQYSDTPFVTDISNSRSTSWGASWYYGENTVRHSFTVDFGTSERARYFFNSGGQIRFSASRSGGTGSNAQNESWTTLLSEMGTIFFDYDKCQGQSGIGSNIGYYDLTATPQQVFTKTSGSIPFYGSAYSANDYTITMSCSVADNSLGEARYLYVNIYFNDDHTARFQSNDTVDGILTSTVSVRRATEPVLNTGVEVPIPNAVNTILLNS